MTQTRLPDLMEPFIAQGVANLVQSGYRIVDPEGKDITDVIREQAEAKKNDVVPGSRREWRVACTLQGCRFAEKFDGSEKTARDIADGFNRCDPSMHNLEVQYQDVIEGPWMSADDASFPQQGGQ